jgi:hypothetical protein
MLIVFGNAPTVTSLLLPKGQSLPKPIFMAWLSITITLVILYFSRSKLLPSAILVITREEGFVRRHIGELSLLVAILSVVLTVVGWFFGK